MSTPHHPGGEQAAVSYPLLVTLLVGAIAFIAGGTLGYFAATFAFDRGAEQTAAALEAAIRSASADQQAGAAQAQPTPLPARLEDVSADDDPALGPEDAPVLIVEFSDFRCPYCKRFRDDTLDALLEKYGDQIRFVYRDFPVVGGEAEAQAAECADEQGQFWPYHDALYENFRAQSTTNDYVTLAEGLGLDSDAFRTCMDSGAMRQEIVGDVSDAQAYGVSGTPTFFINGVRLIGAQAQAAFEAVIDQELASQ